MPLSKLIILLRDGRDIIDSLIDARQEGGWLAHEPGSRIEGEQSRLNFIQYQAKLWAKQTELLIKTIELHSKELSLVVKYEDLRSHTSEVLHLVYNFLGIEISDEDLNRLVVKYSFENIPKKWAGKGKFIRTASPGKWSENFNENERQMVEQHNGPYTPSTWIFNLTMYVGQFRGIF
jgi:Sulfotransferase domain